MSLIMRRLSGPRSLADMADILERYVAAAPDDDRCREAHAALVKIRTDNPNFYVRAALRALDSGDAPCASIRKVIEALRKFGRVALR